MATFEPVDHDPFAERDIRVRPVGSQPSTKTPTFEPVDFDPFAPGAATPGRVPPASVFPSITPAAAQPTPSPQAGTASVDQSPAPVPPQSEPAPAPTTHNAFMRGFVTTALKENPRLLGESLEMAGHLSPEGLQPSLFEMSKGIKNYTPDLPDYKPQSKGLFEIRGVDDALTWAGEGLGQMLGSSAVPIAGGVVGGGIGSRVGGKVGAVVGSAGGAAAGSYLLNAGDVYSGLKELKVEPKTAAEYAAIAAAPMAALDSIVPAQLIQRLGGIGEAKREIGRAVARRIIEETAKGSGKEAMTEAIQQTIQQATESVAAENQPFFTVENAKKITEAGALGALGGGAFGAAGGLKSDGTHNAPTPESVAAAVAAMGPTPKPEEVSGAVTAPDERTPNPMWYSPARRAVEEKGPNSATAEQWAATLRNTPGVKQEELTDGGISDFLASRAGQKLSKSDLLNFMEENSIQLTETVRLPKAGVEGGWGSVIRNEPGVARFEGYTLPGERQGYTEILMQLPEQESAREKLEKRYAQVQEQFRTGAWRNLSEEERIAAEQESDALEIELRKTPSEELNFTHGHWPGNKNVLAHIRVTDRLDLDGAPMAVVEEIQSDWLQKGREEGFKGKPSIEDFARAMGVDPYQISPEEAQMLEREYAKNPAFKTLLDGDKVPNAPFKQSWDELALKRMLRWAADKGYKRIGFVTGEQQIERYGQEGGLSTEQQRGMLEFYNKKLPSMAKKWAKRLGGTVGLARVPRAATPVFELDFNDRRREIGAYNTQTGAFVEFEDLSRVLAGQGGLISDPATDAILEEGNRRIAEMNAKEAAAGPQFHEVPFIELPTTGVDMVQQGLPLYDEKITSNKVTAADGVGLDVRSAMTLQPVIQQMIKGFGLIGQIEVFVHENGIVWRDPNTGRTSRRGQEGRGLAVRVGPGQYQIHANLALLQHPADLFATLMHELGHVLMWSKFEQAPTATKLAVQADYERWRRAVAGSQTTVETIAHTRDNPVTDVLMTRHEPGVRPLTMEEIGPQQARYMRSFEEWFAESTARWATTTAKPLTVVEKFFKSLADQIISLFERAVQTFNLDYKVSGAMQKFLDDTFNGIAASEALTGIVNETNRSTQKQNQQHLDPTNQDPAEPEQVETSQVRKVINSIYLGRPPAEAQQLLAQVDKFNVVYKYGIGVHQLAKVNSHIQGLATYVETLALANWNKQNIMDEALTVLKSWANLRGKQGDAVSALIDDVTNMVYLSEDERKQGTARMPTPQEFAELVAKHKVSEEGVQVFQQIAASYQKQLDRYAMTLMRETGRIADPAARATAQNAIAAQITRMKSKPYFPFMRFGNYTITIRDAAGKVKHFETFEKARKRDLAMKDLQKQLETGDHIQASYLEKDVAPLMGMPPGLLDLIAEKLELSDTQRSRLDELRFELAPAQSYKHRFQSKKGIAGYSQNFKRAYANSFFHGASHLVRAQYADSLRELVKATRAEVALATDITKRKQITEYMNKHLSMWLNPKPDWYAVNSVAAVWFLGFSPASAMLNLTQTLVTTAPFLASKFGDHKALPALLRAGTQLNSYYRKGKYGPDTTDFELKAIGEGIRDGTITEAMGPELAAMSEGRNLRSGFGGNPAQSVLTFLAEKGMFMFSMAEQINRRVAFRAALKLAMQNPNAKYVKEMVDKHSLAYGTLRQAGWTEQEAAAYVTAKDTVETTQFKYGKDYGPRFMSGKARSIFVFKTFIQNMVFFMGSNGAGTAIRSLLVMGFLGGMMGLPGAEDLEAALKAIAWQFFGKDFDLEKEARKFVLDLIGQDEKGKELTDTIMHGLARRGFGIPHLMDLLGGTVGYDVPMPTFDRSRSVSMGLMLPVDLGKLFGPQGRGGVEQAISSEAQRASGAAFGFGFNMYKFLTDTQLSWQDPKWWERVMPRAAAGVSKSYRAMTEGGERTRTGAFNVRYDMNDPEQMFEAIGMALGYTPLRQSLAWDRAIAGMDAVKGWDIKREGLMRQFDAAYRGGVTAEIDSVKGAIQKYNESLPDEARGKAITSDSLQKSMAARARARAAREEGLSVRKSDIPILLEVQRLYPDAKVTGTRRVQGTP